MHRWNAELVGYLGCWWGEGTYAGRLVQSSEEEYLPTQILENGT